MRVNGSDVSLNVAPFDSEPAS